MALYVNNARRRIDPLKTTIVLLWVITSAILLPHVIRKGVFRDGFAGSPIQLCGTINPNDAAWWELSLLPEIGEITARQIVEYRMNQHPEHDDLVFKNAEDLTGVRGIGPKTVEKLAPLLRFTE